MATLKKKSHMRATSKGRTVPTRRSTTGHGFLSRANRHIVPPATASQIMKAVGLSRADIIELRRLIAKYAPLEPAKAARRRAASTALGRR